MGITHLGNAEGVSAYKTSYHQFSLNNLMKIESVEFKLYFDGVFFMPPTSEKLRGHIGLVLSVRQSIRPSMRLSVTLGS